MNTKLKSLLENKIREWAIENCEDDDIWPYSYFGDKTEKRMTDAAEAVFDAVVETQDYALREGLLFDK